MIEATPNCIGVIIDGNRRYARANNISTVEGHRAGYEKLREFARWAKEAGIEYGIAYTFSTENWNRPKEEVSYLMDLLRNVLKKEIDSIRKEGVRLQIIGQRSRFSEDIQSLLDSAEKETKGSSSFTLVLALSYGGRAEILDAVRELVSQGKKNPTEQDFEKVLWTQDIPDPDMIIRTGGELRLSNFLPWQSSYSELFFTNTLWPAFTKEEFTAMLKTYASRDRRRGN